MDNHRARRSPARGATRCDAGEHPRRRHRLRPALGAASVRDARTSSLPAGRRLRRRSTLSQWPRAAGRRAALLTGPRRGSHGKCLKIFTVPFRLNQETAGSPPYSRSGPRVAFTHLTLGWEWFEWIGRRWDMWRDGWLLPARGHKRPEYSRGRERVDQLHPSAADTNSKTAESSDFGPHSLPSRERPANPPPPGGAATR